MLLSYDPKECPVDCMCEPCQLFAQVFREGFPAAWMEGHNLPFVG